MIYKILAISFFLLSISSSYASEDKLLCSTVFAYHYRPKVINLSNDKLKHCSLSCMIAKRCLSAETSLLGLLKEFSDLFTDGNAEWADIKANYRGIKISRKVQTVSECIDQCKYYY